MPSHTSPNDLLSITTFDNTEKDITMHEKPGHLQHISEEIIATSVDDKKENIIKHPIKDNDDIHDNVTDKSDNNTKHSLGKRKLVPAKSLVIDENGAKVKKRRTTTDQNMADQHNSNIENGETSNKDAINRNKTTETDKKRKKKLSVNNTFKLEDTSLATVKKDSRGSATKLDRNKTIEMASGDKSCDENNKKESISQDVKCPVKKNTDATINNIEEKETGTDERKKKKNRKKRSNFQQDITSDMMQVMAKQDWKRLRNKYLELQKSKMQQLKLHLKKARWNYDKSKHEKDEKTSEMEKSCYGRITYAPGIIVKIEMDEPCTDPQNFKVYFYFVPCYYSKSSTFPFKQKYYICFRWS